MTLSSSLTTSHAQESDDVDLSDSQSQLLSKTLSIVVLHTATGANGAMIYCDIHSWLLPSESSQPVVFCNSVSNVLY